MAQKVPKGGLCEEVLLHKAEQLPFPAGVVGIEDAGDIFGDGALAYGAQVIEIVEFLKVEIVHGLGPPQTQPIHIVRLVTRHDVVVGNGF